MERTAGATAMNSPHIQIDPVATHFTTGGNDGAAHVIQPFGQRIAAPVPAGVTPRRPRPTQLGHAFRRMNSQHPPAIAPAPPHNPVIVGGLPSDQGFLARPHAHGMPRGEA